MTAIENITSYAETVMCRDGVLRPVWADRSAVAREYFDTEWGREVRDERGLFELLTLLVFAGGLSWAGVLARREGLRAGLAGFAPDVVAGFDDEDVRRLSADASMIRNGRKIRAVVTNARATVAAREQGGLPALVWSTDAPETPTAAIELTAVPRCDTRSIAVATTLRDAGFTHVGPVAAQALLLACGAAPVRRARTSPQSVPDADWKAVQESF